MPDLTPAQLKELKEQLMEEKKDLTAHFERNQESEGELGSSIKDTSGELSSYDNHPADLGTESFEKGRDMAIDASLGERLEEVNQSLELLKTDVYGKCEVCGEDIEFERLQALPTASRCILHAEDAGPADYRPVEEQAMTPPPSGPAGREGSRFDEADAWRALEEYGNASDTVNPDAK